MAGFFLAYIIWGMIQVKKVFDPQAGLNERFIPDYEELSRVVKSLKEWGYRIVLTQGVFDLFHIGHGRYFAEAKNHPPNAETASGNGSARAAIGGFRNHRKATLDG